MTISGIFALKEQETNGAIHTNAVDIKINNYTIDENGQEVDYGNEPKIVVPGDVISLIPKVSNQGMDCYLRIKVFYIDENTNFENYVTNFLGDFTKQGDYYYYNKTFKSGENLKIFDTIKIPDDIDDIFTNGYIKLTITAEAVQSKNFKPDYELEDPWNGVEPTETTNETYDIDNKNSKIYVKYEDNTDTNINISNDFFEKASSLVPGDVITSTIEIDNKDKNNANFFLHFDKSNNSQEEIELLDQITLIITNKDGKEIYNGKLSTNDKIFLGKYNKGDKDSLQFKIIVPADLDNKYENINPKLSLVFSAEYEKNNPKTGDTIYLATAIFLISSVCFIAVIVLYCKERKKNSDEE